MLNYIGDEVQLKAMASEGRRRQAIARFHEILEKVDISAYAEGLNADMVRRHVFYGDRLVCPFLRPTVITAEQLTLMKRAVRGVVAAMNRMVPKILANKELQAMLGLTPVECDLMAIDPGYEGASITSRLDSFLNGGNLTFVEYNAESPAGIGYGDEMTRAFESTEVARSFAKSYPFETIYCDTNLLKALLSCYAQYERHFGKAEKRPNIAIVDFKGVATHHEFTILANYFESQGYRTVIADPRELEYDGKVLSADGFAIDLLYRRVLTNEFIEEMDKEQAMLQAFRDHNVCVVNCFRSKFLHKKSIFSLISDPRWQDDFSEEELAAVKAYIPWTRRLDCGLTLSPQGQECDIVPFIRKNREHIVMKPNDSYGGRGIYLGWESTAGDWDKAIQDCLGHDYLVQWRIPTQTEAAPFWDGERPKWGEYTVDLDPFVFAGELSGFTARLGASALCNVTAGGGAVPCFIV